jgi:acetyl-CoA acetyltransferase
MPVWVTGVGMHPFGRHATSLTGMGVTAVRAALDDADRRKRGDFQVAYCGTAYGGIATGHKVLGALGLTGGPIIDVEAGCASGAAALSLACTAIESGECETVLVLGVEKMPKGMIRSSFFEPWAEAAGLNATPAYFALRAQRLMQTSGVTEHQLAEVVVKNRANGSLNPMAMFQKAVSVDEVLESRRVCDPLRLWMMCSPNEGAAAVVLSSDPPPEGRARVRVAATRLRSHLAGDVLGEGTPLSGLPDRTGIPTPTELAATAAYEASGVGPHDLDLAEVQDTDAARELLAYEELGFCEPDSCAEWFAGGHSQPDGDLPVNRSGGLLSKGEPLGASAIGHVVELTWQLRGLAGPRQLGQPMTALAHNVGRGANASVSILQR